MENLPSAMISNGKTRISTPTSTHQGDAGKPEIHVHPQISGWFSEYSLLWPGSFYYIICIKEFKYKYMFQIRSK